MCMHAHEARALGRKSDLTSKQNQRDAASASLRLQAPCAQPKVKLRSSCELSSGAAGGALASCVAWLPQPPHDLVAVGHWDGSCALWRLLPGARCGGARQTAVSICGICSDWIQAVGIPS